MYLERHYSTTEQKFYDAIALLIVELPVVIYDLEYIVGSKTLRLFIIDPATKSATIEDCVSVDRALSDYFESSDWIPEEIVLEVSSPGIYRGLFKKSDFTSSLGESVLCEFKRKVSSEMFEVSDRQVLNQKKIIGTLKSCDAEFVGLEFFGEHYKIPFELVRKINIESN